MKFKFDKRIKDGYYSASYFKKTENIIKKYLPNQNVCLQFFHFNKQPVKVCGIEECIQLLKSSLNKDELSKIKVYGVKDGDLVAGKKPIILIFGPYEIFGKYENLIDGILARRSSVCNNCHKILTLINTNQLIYMADRTDDYILQPYDGYAAYIGGVRNFVTNASIEFIKDKKDVNVTGTIPHALIQEFDGNLNNALNSYMKEYGTSHAVALIDYHNDVGSEIKKLSTQFKNLFAIRVDTSSNLIDKGLQKQYAHDKSAYGVSWQLINYTRKTLDAYGFKNTKIIASSGIDYEKILNFQKHKSPIDFYGIGSSLITRNIHFAADLVLKNNQHQAKIGRKLFININRLKTLKKYI